MFPPKVLLLSRDNAETRKWMEILQEHVLLTEIRDGVELREALRSDEYGALLCSWSFPKENWTDALRTVEDSCPDLPVIVCSETCDEQEWNQAIKAGAFDLLAAPYWKDTVIPVLEQAVDSRAARRWHRAAPQAMARAV